jgi:hypothetical protein
MKGARSVLAKRMQVQVQVQVRAPITRQPLTKARAGLTPIDSCDEYETYDARVEKEEKDNKPTQFFPRKRLNSDMLTRAVTEAIEICKSSDKQGCAAFWDVAEELFEAYAHQYDEEETVAVAPWSMKVREYE